VATAEREAFLTPAARDYRSPNAESYEARGGGKKGEQLPNAIGGQLNADWVELLMGWPMGWSSLQPVSLEDFQAWIWEKGRYGRQPWADGSWEADIPRVARGRPARVDRLKAIGNGQVPQVVVLAWTILMALLTERKQRSSF
jgi:hypothetical protein